MKLSIVHTTRVDYESPVTDGIMVARLGPLTDDDQRWERFELRATPHAAVRSYADGFGNTTHLVTAAQPHEFLQVTTRGIISTILADPFAPLSRPPRPLGPRDQHDYLASSGLVPLVTELAAMADPFRPAGTEEAFAAVQAMMRMVHADFRYERQVTTVSTTVAEVVHSRHGVCQDFAHVLIGLCRTIGVPSRYVSGYLIVDRSHAESDWETSAAVASHAWVEAYTPTHGWRGFDPTNGLVAGEDHVKMAIGRDYADVPPTRGMARGGAGERLQVEVSVERLD